MIGRCCAREAGNLQASNSGASSSNTRPCRKRHIASRLQRALAWLKAGKLARGDACRRKMCPRCVADDLERRASSAQTGRGWSGRGNGEDALGVNPDFLHGKMEEIPSVLHLSSTFPDWECDRKMTESPIFQRISNIFSNERLFNQLARARALAASCAGAHAALIMI